MKITFILSTLGIRGGHRVIYEYANRLQERGHEVSIVYPIVPPFPVELLKQNGLKNSALKFFKTPNLLKERNWEMKAELIRVPILSAKLSWMFERKIPDSDVIIATDYSTAHLVAKLDEKKGNKFHFIQHYEIFDCWNDERCWERVKKIEKGPNKFCFTMADIDTSDLPFDDTKKLVDSTLKLPLRKITVSIWLKELLRNKFGQKAEVIINGVNFKTFYNENKIWNEKKRILAPYQTTKWKGAEDAIKAFEIVKERFPNTQFVMFDIIKGKVPDWIEFHVNPSDDDLRKLYSSCDIFVFPSWVEGFGLPPMEAMACRCAVVTTNVGWVREYTKENICLACPPREPGILAEKISCLIENDAIMRNISWTGYNFIKQFTWERATDKFERILEKMR